MAKTLSNVSTQSFENLLKKGVSEGVMSALAARDAIESAKAEHEAMLAQHVKVVGEGQDTDPMSKVSDNIEAMRQNQDKLTELFASMSQSLSMMNTQQGSPMVGSSLASQATASSNEMTLTSSTPMNTGTVGSAFKNFTVANNSVSAQAPTPSPVDSSQGYQEAMTSPVPVEKENYEESNKKAQAAEEDRLYKEAARPVMPKLSRALDMYLEGKNSSTNNGGDGSTSLAEFLASLAGGATGFVIGYLGKWGETIKDVGQGIAKGWNTVKNFVKESSVFKSISGAFESLKTGAIDKINSIKGAFTGFIDSGMAKVETFKNSFTAAIDGWKAKLGFGEKPTTLSKPPKAPPKAPAPKTSGGLLNSLKNLGSKIGSHVANLPGVQSAMKWGRIGMKLGEKLPFIQAAGSIVDTGVNVYKGMQKGMGLGDMTDMIMGGTLNAATDLFMVPELMNAAEGMISSHVKGGSLWDTLKAGGKGFFKPRDNNEIGHGDAMWAQWKEWSKDTPLESVAGALGIENMVGKKAGDDRYAKLLRSYQNGTGWKEAGYEVTSSAAAGFGHSAGVYRPKAAGSMENSKTPTATVVPNLPTESQMSEADRMNAIKEGMKEGVKEALLSPEVQEANMKNAKETGAAINGQLFGG